MSNQLYKGNKPLATFIPQIADNLTTDDSTKALSAKQGKVLNDKIEGIGYKALLSSLIVSTTAEVEATLLETSTNFDFLDVMFGGGDGSQYSCMLIPTDYQNMPYYMSINESTSVYAYGQVKVNADKIYVKSKQSAGWTGFKVLQVYGIKL